MNAPLWAITLAYWFHMLATVVWIGGLAALALLVLPAAARSQGEQGSLAYLSRIQRRLDWMGWFSLAVLVGTGLLQMSAHPRYEGFLSIGNRWAAAILIKHLVIFAMAGVSATITWGVFPRLQRMALLAGRGRPVSEEQQQRVRRVNARLIYTNLALGIIVLALTALARVS